MKYVMAIYDTQEDFNARNGKEKEAYWAAWAAYSQALGEAGVLTGGSAMEAPSSATTLRLRNGKRQIQDGPYADSKEQLGGFMVLEVASLDEALRWAEKCPSARMGVLELRPVLEMGAHH